MSCSILERSFMFDALSGSPQTELNGRPLSSVIGSPAIAVVKASAKLTCQAHAYCRLFWNYASVGTLCAQLNAEA
jgi:hypothetical protein